MSPQTTAEQHAGDPTVLATLCSNAFSTKLSNDADFIRSISDTEFQHGITDDKPTNDRTLRVLDSIAEILVSQASHEVIAVAFGHTPHGMDIYIASNGPPRTTAVLHLQHLFNKLTLISDMVAETRTDPKWKDWKKPSPEIKPPLEIQRHQIQFLIDVYVFSWAKMDKRLKKWVPRLKAFLRDLKAVQLDKLGVDRKLLALLKHPLNAIFRCEKDLKTLVDLTKADPLSSKAEWEVLVFGMYKASQDATKILDDRLLCERVAFSANNSGMFGLLWVRNTTFTSA
jgi:hypothetical protein